MESAGPVPVLVVMIGTELLFSLLYDVLFRKDMFMGYPQASVASQKRVSGPVMLDHTARAVKLPAEIMPIQCSTITVSTPVSSSRLLGGVAADHPVILVV